MRNVVFERYDYDLQRNPGNNIPLRAPEGLFLGCRIYVLDLCPFSDGLPLEMVMEITISKYNFDEV